MNILSSSLFFIPRLLGEHLGRGEMTSALKQALQAALTHGINLGSFFLYWRHLRCSLDDVSAELFILCSSVYSVRAVDPRFISSVLSTFISVFLYIPSHAT